ncbi:hypothetical protein [Aurantimonas sp. DM33-3]|uniref:hypothetical protein n=1 Tax=Aurantimonas sp. DM33-3 TaxID=2766955 RepID=UPI001FF07D40|nr:hypothetical protein [Aurantimonas sp. DM33-3]
MMPAPLPVLMRRDEIISLARASAYARRSEVQIRRWCKQYGISRQTTPNSPQEISRVALEMVLHGDMAALEMLREGERSAPEVQRYLAFLNIPE